MARKARERRQARQALDRPSESPAVQPREGQWHIEFSNKLAIVKQPASKQRVLKMASSVGSSSSDGRQTGTNNAPEQSSLNNNTKHHDKDDDKNNNILHSLEQDLASIIRVRNRLADTPDTRLPKVLTQLLPRLLRRLDETNLALCRSFSNNDEEANTAQSSSIASAAAETATTPTTTTSNNQAENRPISDETTKDEARIRSCREQIQLHLTGMLSHILERVRVRYCHGSAASCTSLSSAPWVHSLLQLIQEKDSPALQSNVTWTLTLSLLQNGLPACGEALDAPRLLPPLLRLLDVFFGRFHEDPTSKSHQLQYRSAGWLFWMPWHWLCSFPCAGVMRIIATKAFWNESSRGLSWKKIIIQSRIRWHKKS